MKETTMYHIGESYSRRFLLGVLILIIVALLVRFLFFSG